MKFVLSGFPFLLVSFPVPFFSVTQDNGRTDIHIMHAIYVASTLRKRRI